MTDEFLYRFRSTKSLFDFQELERQELYFSTPEKLNDPVEGLKKTLWNGDTIIWKKLLEHYIHCFSNVMQLSWVYFYYPTSKYEIIVGTTNQIEKLNNQNFPKDTIIWHQAKNDIYFINTHTGVLSNFKLLNEKKLNDINSLQEYLFSIENTLRTAGLCIHLDKSVMNFIPNEFPNSKVIFNEIYAKFLSLNVTEKFIEVRSDSNHISDREELVLHLLILNRYAINVVVEVFKQHHLCPQEANIIEIPEDYEKNTLFLLSQNLKNNSESDLWLHNRVSNMIFQSLKLIMDLVENASNCSQFMKFFLLEFSEYYVQMLEDNIFPKWGTVCFSKSYSNLAMWGYYADCHKGIALKVRTKKENNDYLINLYQPTSFSREVEYSYQAEKFFKVTYGYENAIINIDFFRNLGGLSKLQLIRWWYDLNGEKSICATSIFDDESKWRKNYWTYFVSSITTKHKDWEHEEEYRLIKYDNFFPIDEYAYKQYKFNDLDGVIFGLKTSEEDKKKIISIIQQKSRSLYEQVCDVVNFNYKLDFECVKEIESLIHDNSDLFLSLVEQLNKMKISFGKLSRDIIHEELAKLLYQFDTFKRLGSVKRRNYFNFYQAYYCDKEHMIKHYKILTI